MYVNKEIRKELHRVLDEMIDTDKRIGRVAEAVYDENHTVTIKQYYINFHSKEDTII